MKILGWDETWHGEERDNLVERKFYFLFVPIYATTFYHSTWLSN
jgi:hypothetical protein